MGEHSVTGKRWGKFGPLSPQILRVPARPGPSLDARDDRLLFPRINGNVRSPTGATQPPVIPSVERGTWVGGDAQDEVHASGRVENENRNQSSSRSRIS